MIATKMSTSPACNHCSHSARGVFKNQSRTDKPEKRRGRACSKSRAYASVLFLYVLKIKKKGSFTILFESGCDLPLKGLFFSVPPCLALMKPGLLTPVKRTMGTMGRKCSDDVNIMAKISRFRLAYFYIYKSVYVLVVNDVCSI